MAQELIGGGGTGVSANKQLGGRLLLEKGDLAIRE